MTINAQSGPGEIVLFEDSMLGDVIANTATQRRLGDFKIFGDGIAETDSGVAAIGSDELSGVGRLTTTNEDKHACCLGTGLMFDVALMAPIVIEARVRFATLPSATVKQDTFIGLADTVGDDLAFEDDMISGATTTITLTASDLVGFYLCGELTDAADWHAVYNGGSTTGETVSTNVDLDDDAIAGEWQVLRLEVGPNGTARWYIDGVLKKTLEGACSTTTDMGVVCGVQTKETATIRNMDVDYLRVTASRDWNA